MTRTKRNRPRNPDSPRVLRGGCWTLTPSWVRAARRYTDLEPWVHGDHVGFRCSLTGRMKR